MFLEGAEPNRSQSLPPNLRTETDGGAQVPSQHRPSATCLPRAEKDTHTDTHMHAVFQ